MTKTSPTIERCPVCGGFTLIEMMVAIVIATVVIGAATASWLAVLRTHRSLEDAAAMTQSVNVAQERLGNDLARAVANPQLATDQMTVSTRDATGHPGRCTWVMTPHLIRRWQPDTGSPTEEVWSQDGLTATCTLIDNRGLRLVWHLDHEAAADLRPLPTSMFPLRNVQEHD